MLVWWQDYSNFSGFYRGGKKTNGGIEPHPFNHHSILGLPKFSWILNFSMDIRSFLDLEGNHYSISKYL